MATNNTNAFSNHYISVIRSNSLYKYSFLLIFVAENDLSMALYRIIISILLICLTSIESYSQYTKYINNDGIYKKKTSWTKRPTLHGLRTSQSTGHVLSLSLGTNYYFGDVEFPGIVIMNTLPSDWINAHLGLYTKLSYMFPLNHYFGIKPAISIGKLQANNFEYQDKAERKKQFSSLYIEPQATIEYYPFATQPRWVYIFAGFSLNFSKISYQHYTYSGTNNIILPMIPIGIGSSFPLSRNVLIGVDLEYHIGLLDTYYCNLDSYPFRTDTNEIVGKSSNWADSYFSIGISLSYVFEKKTCPTCHFID